MAKEVWISIRSDGYQGTGVPGDAYDGSSPTALDNFFNLQPENTLFHFGSGLFLTRGFTEAYPDPGSRGAGFRAKSGWRIVGAGMFQTTLKLVEGPSDSSLHSVIGSDQYSFVDGFECRDLTLDANMGGQPVPAGADWPDMACGGIAIFGRRLHFRRVRAINFGTQGTPAHTQECFVLYPKAADNYEGIDLIVDDCIVEQPFPNSTGSISPVIFGAGDVGSTRTIYHKASVIRNCLTNFDFIDREVAIASISISGSIATVTTKVPHRRVGGEWVVITGALINGSLGTTYNGAYQISNVTLTTFQYTPVAYNTIKYGSLGVPTVDATGDMYIGRTSCHRVALKSISATGSPPYIATLETDGPHRRLAGQAIRVINVLFGLVPSAVYNGAFKISAVTSPTTLTYQIAGPPEAGTPDVSIAFIGGFFQALTADTGIGTVVERNRVFNTEGGLYHDTFRTKDLTIRKNGFYNVLAAEIQNLGLFANWALSSLTNSGTTATVETFGPHGLSKGQFFGVQHAYVGTLESSLYNGNFYVDSVIGPTWCKTIGVESQYSILET